MPAHGQTQALSHPGPTSESRPKPLPRKGKTGRSSPPRTSIWLYGSHAVQAGLENPHRRWSRLLATAQAARGLAGIWRPEIVDRHVIERVLPPDAVHQGLALEVAPLAQPDLRDAAAPVAGERGIVVVLDRVSDPQNVGAILRSAAAFGARAVVTTERHVPAATGALAKAASGALEIVPFVRIANLAQALRDLAALGYWCVGLAADAPLTLAEAKPPGNVALVLGAEGTGLRRLTAERCDALARLPVDTAMSQLNVSNAAAIALYELARDER